MDVLLRIKRLVYQGRVRFSRKARDELYADGLVPSDVLESILNARAIAKTLRSRSSVRRHGRERLYVIKSLNFTGTVIYSKGAIVQEAGKEVYYILISAKVSDSGQ